MTLDRSVAERRRFARLLGIADGRGSGLPVGSSTDDASGTDRPVTEHRSTTDGGDVDR